MTSYIYVQMDGIEKPAKIEGDRVEKESVQSSTAGNYILKVMLEEKQVGEFKGPKTLGWWMETE